MNKLLSSLPGVLLATLTPGAFLFAADQYKIDSDHTLVAFEVDHFGFSSSLGWVGGISGSISYDAEDLSNSSVKVSLLTGSIVTNNDQRDAWIKSAKVLNAAAQPVMSFRSSSIGVSSGTISKITGDLSMNGVSLPVELAVTFNGAAPHPISKKDTIGFSATTVINRSDWGVDAFVGQIGDEVVIRIELEATETN